jgi:hypothetical protein
MTIQSVEAKLHEARSALAEMRDQEQRAFGDRSRFDHRLSAFLNAGRSVDNRLQHECGATYRDWRKTWNAQHPTEDRILESAQSTDGRRSRGYHFKAAIRLRRMRD